MPDLIYKNKIVSFRAGDVISICPPLSIDKDEIDFLVSGLDESIKEISKILSDK